MGPDTASALRNKEAEGMRVHKIRIPGDSGDIAKDVVFAGACLVLLLLDNVMSLGYE